MVQQFNSWTPLLFAPTCFSPAGLHAEALGQAHSYDQKTTSTFAVRTDMAFPSWAPHFHLGPSTQLRSKNWLHNSTHLCFSHRHGFPQLGSTPMPWAKHTATIKNYLHNSTPGCAAPHDSTKAPLRPWPPNTIIVSPAATAEWPCLLSESGPSTLSSVHRPASQKQVQGDIHIYMYQTSNSIRTS